MRSVVVVLPASTWAMMPILRISERGVVRGIARFRKNVNEEGRGGLASKPHILTRYRCTCRHLVPRQESLSALVRVDGGGGGGGGVTPLLTFFLCKGGEHLPPPP